MKSKDNVKKILQSIGISLAIIGTWGSNPGLIMVGGGLSLLGILLILKW